MIVTIDASNLRAGGGVTHIVRLLHALAPEDGGIDKVIVWGGARTLARMPERSWLVRKTHLFLDRALPYRVFWQQRCLTPALQADQSSVLFAPGGTLPARCATPTVTMSQNMLPFQAQEARRYPRMSLMRLRLWLLARAQRRSFASADGVIFLSSFARQTILNQLPRPPKMSTVIAHGIEPRFFAPSKPIRGLASCSEENPFRLLYVSIVDVYKHQWNIVRAVGALHNEGCPLTLDLVGTAYPTALRWLQHAMDQVDPQRMFIRYHGPQPFDTLHETYAKSDGVFFGSTCENLPIILLEAMASGTPILSSHLGPMPEVLAHGGFYCDPRSVPDLVDNLRRFLDARQERYKRAQMAQDIARGYTWETCARETFRFIRNVAETATLREA